ncbi:unnamed protein product [Withania somnifera]
MASSSTSKLLFCILASLFLVSSAQNCSEYTFPANRTFTSCKELPYLEANLHWNYNSSSTDVSIAYRAKQNPKGWVAWAINPTSQGMEAKLSFRVSNISAEYSNNEMIIFATIGPLGNTTIVNHVWQGGNSVSGNIPQMHPLSSPHLQSFGKIDFQTV